MAQTPTKKKTCARTNKTKRKTTPNKKAEERLHYGMDPPLGFETPPKMKGGVKLKFSNIIAREQAGHNRNRVILCATAERRGPKEAGNEASGPPAYGTKATLSGESRQKANVRTQTTFLSPQAEI